MKSIENSSLQVTGGAGQFFNTIDHGISRRWVVELCIRDDYLNARSQALVSSQSVHIYVFFALAAYLNPLVCTCGKPTDNLQRMPD